MKTRVLRVIGALLISVVSLSTTAAPVLPLEPRLGGLADYDPNLDITLAADANINGANAWVDQLDWVASLTIAGISGWRLPSADVNGDRVVVNCSGGGVSGCDDNEMGYLFWEEGITGLAPSPLSNIQFGISDFYWSSTDAGSKLVTPWAFNFTDGSQDFGDWGFPAFALAVKSGDVGAVPVPVPAAIWLFGSGLLGLIGIARGKTV